MPMNSDRGLKQIQKKKKDNMERTSLMFGHSVRPREKAAWVSQAVYRSHSCTASTFFVVYRPFDLVTILFIAVSHGDPLHPSFSH